METSVNARRTEERKEEIRSFVIAASSWLSLPLFVIFWVADIIYAPEQMWEFLGYRLLIVPICLATNWLMRRAQSLNSVQSIAAAYVLANSLIITTLIYKLEGPSSPYYAGLNLVAMGIIYFPWTRQFLALNSIILYGPFVAGALISGHRSDLPTFLLSLFFIAGTVVITLFIRYSMEKLRRKELDSRIRLEEELRTREEIIKRKTREAVYLNQLAKQFSPQVVHSLKDASTEVLNRLQYCQICAIFVDIVGSTEKINVIPMEKFSAAIKLFLEDSTGVLLKHDITIDKFLGDGVLGFSNAPIQRQDYVPRVAEAAMEILGRIQNREEYMETWGSPLKIRIGIASGQCNVGFFGNDNSIRAYTAIGRPVNLAARICSACNENEILVSKEVHESLPSSSYEMRKAPSQSLKGFAEDMELFELAQRSEQADGDLEECPNGHGILHLDTNDRGIFVLKCRACGYQSDDSDDQRVLKAA